jgi:hypothetical protein
MQSDDGLESYVKGRINPLIDEHDFLRPKRAHGRSTTACTSSASAA